MGLGDDFVIALGLTLPQKEYEKLAKANGILRQQTDKPNIKRIKNKQKVNYNDIAQENKVPERQDAVSLRQRTSSLNNLANSSKINKNNSFCGSSSLSKNKTGLHQTKKHHALRNNDPNQGVKFE